MHIIGKCVLAAASILRSLASCDNLMPVGLCCHEFGHVAKSNVPEFALVIRTGMAPAYYIVKSIGRNE